jgi:type I restriction enzyme S subunit
LDELIQAETERLEALQAHKKGLMQQLFPAEGETAPKLRFPEFQDSGEWEKAPLADVAKKINSRVGNKKVKLMSITSGIGLVSQIEKFGKEIAGDSYRNYVLIEKGDFAYNKSSTKLFPEGEIALLEEENEAAVPNSIFTCFRFNDEIIKPSFAKYLFSNNLHGKWLRKFIATGARANGALQVEIKHLFALPLFFPSIIEQRKISRFLSSIDEQIKSQTESVESLKSHKKGLLQQLFPQLES